MLILCSIKFIKFILYKFLLLFYFFNLPCPGNLGKLHDSSARVGVWDAPPIAIDGSYPALATEWTGRDRQNKQTNTDNKGEKGEGDKKKNNTDKQKE